MRLLILLACATLSLPAADKVYSVVSERTSVTSSKTTLQMPASSAPRAFPKDVQVYCSVACTVSFEINGTAATATAGTAIALGPWRAARMNVFTASDVGSGTKIWPTEPVSAGSTKVFEFADVELEQTSTAKNFTVVVSNDSAASGNIYIGLKWKEE